MLEKKHIILKDSVNSWQESIKLAASCLVEDNIITTNYVNKMIENIVKLGPYILISPDVALPHARCDDGVIKSGISLLKLNHRVCFDPVNKKTSLIIIVVASSSGLIHLELLKYITTILSNNKKYNQLLKSQDVESIYKIFNEEA